MSQHDIYYLADRPRSYALLSEGHTESLTVFVHGFWGDATSTWSEFQRLVDDAKTSFPNLNNSDLLFFDYPSTMWTIEVAAHHLLAFLKSVYPRTDEQQLAPVRLSTSILGLESHTLLPRPMPLEYKTLTLVGHSMGGVVLRRTILLELEHQLDTLRVDGSISADSLLRANLILFAPAHLGFKYSNLADTVSATHWALATLRLLYQIRYAPSYAELTASSPVLDSIRVQSERFAIEFPSATALRAKIIWGAEENIVFMGGYAEDMTRTPVLRRSHMDVCKPSDHYQLPLEVINGSGKTADVSATSFIRSESFSPRASKIE